MHSLIALVLCCAAVTSSPSSKILGGSVTTIDNYPTVVALLWARNLVTYYHDCGGSILNSRTILTAAFCNFDALSPHNLLVRVGSTYASSGGVVHSVSAFVNHPEFNRGSYRNNDIGIVRTTSDIVFGNNVQAAFVAGAKYNLPDNSGVWAVGWGYSEVVPSEQLRHVELKTVNQETCRRNYASIGYVVDENMLCSGNLPGQGQCWADCGGPLYHNGVVVCTLRGFHCGSILYPSVYTRVSQYIAWIQENA